MGTFLSTKRLVILLLLFGIILSAVLFLRSPGGLPVHPEEAVGLYPALEYRTSGLEVSGHVFTPTGNHPQLEFAFPPCTVRSVTVLFEQPMARDTSIQVYYAPEGVDFSEENSVQGIVRSNGTELSLPLPPGEYASLRLDTDGQVALKEISLNSSLAEIYAKRLLALLLAVSVLVFVVDLFSGQRVETLYLVFSLALGLVYLLSLTPLSVPDEHHHYETAYKLSDHLLGQQGDASAFRYEGFTFHYNSSSGYNRVMETVSAPAAEQGRTDAHHFRDLSYPPMYLPQALGLALGRAVNANFIWTFWLGRLFNLLFYVFCTYWAIRIAPRFQALLALVALAPMSLHQAASYSYDAFVNSLSLLLLSLLLKAILEEGSWSTPAFAATLAVSVLLSPAKIVYYPLCALALLVPKQRYQSRRARILWPLAILLLPLLVLLALRLQAMVSVAAQPQEALNWEGQHNYTIAFLLHHPVRTAMIFLRTALTQGYSFFVCAVGYSLSGLTLTLPKWIPIVYALLLLLSALGQGQGAACLGRRERCSFALAALAVIALVMLSMFLAWTSDTSPVILGVQGRYFIPVLPLVFMVLNNDRFKLSRNDDRELVMLGCLPNLAALGHLITVTLVNK